MAQQVMVLNNGDPAVDGTATQASSMWQAGDAIWSDPNDLDPDNRASLGFNEIGLLPVLVANPDGSTRTVELTVRDEITLRGLRIEGDGYSLLGSTLAGDEPALQGQNAGTPLRFEIQNGSVFNIADVALVRQVAVAGDGTLVYSGDTGADFQSIRVEEHARLQVLADSRIRGALSNEGTADLSGTYDDTITNDGTMNLIGNVTAEEGIENNADSQLSVLSGAAVDVGTKGITNFGIVNIAGAVAGSIENDGDGSVIMEGGSLSNFQNLSNNGTLSGFGRIDSVLDNSSGTVEVTAGVNPGEDTLNVGGELINGTGGNVNVSANAILNAAGVVSNAGVVTLDGELQVVTPGTGTALINDNRINVQNTGTLRVTEGIIRNEGTIVSSGRLIANILNRGQLETTGNSVQSAITNSLASSQWTAQDTTATGNVQNAGTVSLTNSTVNGNVTSSNILQMTDSSISGEVINTGSIELRSGVTGVNSVGSLSNSGDGAITIDSGETLRITNGQFTNSATGADNVSVRGTVDGNVANTGTMSIGATGPGAVAIIEGDLSNGAAGSSSGNLRLRGSTTVNGNLINHGTITSFNSGLVRNTQLEVRDRLTNYGIIQSDPTNNTNTLTIRAAEIANYGSWRGAVRYFGRLLNGGTVDLDEDQQLGYNISNLAGGTVNVTADVDANGHPASNAGSFNIRSGGDFSNAGLFTNSGRLTIDRTSSLSTTQLDNTGIIQSSGDIRGPVNNLSQGVANLSGRVIGLLTNSGVVTTTGNLSVTRLVNNNEVNVTSGNTLSSGNPITNAGELNVAGAVNAILNNTGQTNLNGGTLANTVNNAGTIRGNGRIVGQLDNQATATLDVSGGTLTADQTVNNAGTVRLAHSLIGNINNNSSANVVMTGRRENGQLVSGVQGNVDNSGLVTGVGAISGTLSNLGNATATIGGSVGTIQNGGTSTLTSSADLAAGTITNSAAASVVVGSGTTMSTTNGLTNQGRLTVTGSLGGRVTNTQGATTEFAGAGTRTISGSITNGGRLQGNGTVSADVNNNATGEVVMTGMIGGDLNNRGTVGVTSGRLNVRGTLVNDNQLNVAGGVLMGNIQNHSTMTITGGTSNGGGVLGNITNDASLRANGIIQGNVVNAGTNARADLRGAVTGTITNSGTVETIGNLSIGGLINSAFTRVNTGHILSTTGGIRNSGNLVIDGSIRRVVSASSAGAVRAPGDFELVNEGTLGGAGTINMDIRNEGQLLTTGTIGGYVNNVEGATANISGTVRGRLTNAGNFATTGDLGVASLVTADGGRSTVAAGHTLTAQSISANSGEMTLAGTFTGSMLNATSGTFDLDGGVLNGDMSNNGTVNANGTVSGSIENNSSRFNLTGALTVGGFVNNSGITIETGRNLTVTSGGTYTNTGTTTLNGRLTGAIQNAQGGQFNLISSGVVNGTLLNDGTINAGLGRVTGALTNNGTVDMHRGSSAHSTGDVLRVGGLAGNGSYNMTLNFTEMTGDRIEVQGGAVTGSHHFNFNNIRGMPNQDVGDVITVLDVDSAFRNNYSFTQSGLSGSERIVYRLTRNAEGDLQVASAINPAIGSMLGNIMLSHSLIGTVINRPTSPYVVGMAYEDKEKPCGVGSWARAMGGTATATGAVSGPGGRVNTDIKADYYGMQVGTDMACFNGHFDGWDMAVGGLVGVNRGSTTQPIPNITIDGPNAGIASVTKSDFDQIYGGVYLTASRDRWTLDVQYRYEKTEFDLENTPIEGAGLGLIDGTFSSTANTLAGAVSYAMPVAETGWTVIPQAGFAWSKYKIDDMRFSDGYRMEFGNAERKVGFFGATVTKTFVQPTQNSAFNLYGTATYYNDFAKDTVSIFKKDDGQFAAQRLTADNLGAYTEVSVGSNYIKVLPRVGGRPRQFSAGARIDGRFGDNIDSVGVTGQFRLQF